MSPAPGAAEVTGVAWVPSPPSGCCCCWCARRCGLSPDFVVLVVLLHHVLCLYCVRGLSCMPCTWAWRYRPCVHLILLRVVACACGSYMGLVSGIPLALGVSVSWILLARCSALHKLRSL